MESKRSSSLSRHAFAAVRQDGTVITWGHPQMGGDSSSVREQLVGAACLHLVRLEPCCSSIA